MPPIRRNANTDMKNTNSTPSSPARAGIHLIALVFLAAGGAAVTGCNRSGASSAPVSESVSQSAAGATAQAADPLAISAEPGLMQRLRIEEPCWSQVGARVTVSAHVSVDETRVARVGSPVMGRVVELAVQPGQEVKHGQPLAALHSTALSDAQLSFLRALSRKQVDERAVERARTLLDAGVIGSVELHRREAELAQSKAEFDASHDQLELLGMSTAAVDQLEKTRQINSVLRVAAGMDGTVLERKVTLGQVVQASEGVCDIADLSRVWLVADVPEQSAGHLKVGQQVRAVVPALPDREIAGRLSFVSATVNPATHTVQVRLEVPNPDRKLKPSMLATMVLEDHPEKRVVIPAAALVREENSEHVFVQQETNRFVLRKVTVGQETDGDRVAVEGVQPGEKIITNGAFHLNNERRRRATRGNEGA